MNWFSQMCRNVGLMVHNIKHPEDTDTTVVNKTVQEKKISDTTTLRRTVIDEVEIRKGKP